MPTDAVCNVEPRSNLVPRCLFVRVCTMFDLSANTTHKRKLPQCLPFSFDNGTGAYLYCRTSCQCIPFTRMRSQASRIRLMRHQRRGCGPHCNISAGRPFEAAVCQYCTRARAIRTPSICFCTSYKKNTCNLAFDTTNVDYISPSLSSSLPASPKPSSSSDMSSGSSSSAPGLSPSTGGSAAESPVAALHCVVNFALRRR